MSETEAEDAFVAKLVQAYPEFRLLQPYLRTPAGAAQLAFEGIAHELTQAVFHLPEPVVATGKLQWWAEELERCMAGEARHPLTRQLGRVPAARWDRAAFAPLLAAANHVHEVAPAVDFSAQLAQLRPVFVALEQSRAPLLGAAGQGSEAQADLRALSYLLRQLARLPLDDASGGPAISMQLLARHQLRYAELATAAPARDALVREQLAQIAAALDELVLPAAGSWIARLRVRCERWRARVLPPGDPFAPLWARLDRVPWTTAWQAWREARRGGC